MLWQRVCQHPLIRRYCPDRVTGLQAESESVSLQLQDAGMLNARLVFGCDGAASKVRSLAGIETDSHDYHQKGLVAYVETELSHRDTAWQRFLNTGPLAFLPFGEKRCSIVWSLPDDKAEELLSATPEAFSRALDSAFAGTLGKTRLLSNRAAFPLKRSLAKTVLKGRVLLLGDAAHAVHPLAGQGVNLGLRDVSALRAAFAEARSRNGDALDLHGLQRWARQRYSDNALAALFFENINRLYSNDSMLLSVFRGNLFALTDRLGPVKNALARHAAGL
jgi:2-octaprenyl-3-methyl-6-methoxy-1,4-benzoquinol hydroxylase